MPNGVTLTQYHHLRREDADALLKHWTQRQAAGEIPFRFKKVDKADLRGKRASAVNDNAPTGVEPKDQSEGGTQDAHKDQEQRSEAQGDGEGSVDEGHDGHRQGDATVNPSGVR